ncbi:MAG: hypothetical protein AB7F20_11355 [Geoalkalibacter sp.]
MSISTDLSDSNTQALWECQRSIVKPFDAAKPVEFQVIFDLR